MRRGIALVLILGVWTVFGNPLRDFRWLTGGLSHMERAELLTEAVLSNRVGFPKSYWLIQHTPYGSYKITLFFGLVDNGSFCADLLESYGQRYNESYSCEAVD